MSIITNVEFIDNIKIKKNKLEDYFMGYKIITTDDTFDFLEITDTSDNQIPDGKFACISFLITNSLLCCEEFGIDVICPENKNCDSLIGSTINSIKHGKINEECLTKISKYLDNLNSCVIDMDTSNGTFKFVMHNLDNGYYPHTYYFSFNKFFESGSLGYYG